MVTAQQRRAGQGCFGAALALFMIVGVVSFCASPADDVSPDPDDARTDRSAPEPQAVAWPLSETLRVELERVQGARATLWEGVPEIGVGICDTGDPGDGACAHHQIQFIQEWPRAWRGDYQSRRNVAYCLAGGCSGAVMTDQMSACAWRIAIVDSGDPQVDQTDISNLRMDCGPLDPDELSAAEAKAETISDRAAGPG